MVIMGCPSLPNLVIWCFLLVGVSMVTFPVLGQPSTDGFISIDCGIPGGYTYVDDFTNIPYVSDAQFIETGICYNISASYLYQAPQKHHTTLRSFPNGARNCYNLKHLVQDRRYLIRAIFMYGNYDGLNSARANDPILFDLHIGVNYWDSISISNASATYRTEVMMIASAAFMSVCLINKGSGTPFISSLELRPLNKTIYKAANASQSLVYLYRYHMGTKTVRFPQDRYDRVWIPWIRNPSWTRISTTSTVSNFAVSAFEVPSACMQTAATPVNSTTMRFHWDSEKGTLSEYYLILHISELQSLTGNNTRQFKVFLNGDSWFGPYTPYYLRSVSIYGRTFETGNLRDVIISLNATSNSTHPPILNAFEIYIVRPLVNVPTDIRDVDAIMAIKEEHQVKKNWMGDPCIPKEYAWNGVTCNASTIVAINLSSSRLTGVISSSFSRLKAIEYLDLSYNNLTGPIPGFLADLSSLQVLNLTGNHFNSTIPDALRLKRDRGLLILSINDDIKLCTDENSCLSKKKITAPIIVILSVVGIVLLLVLMFIGWRMRQRVHGMTFGTSTRPGNEDCSGQKMDWENHPLQLETRQFTHKQLVNITNNFVRVIGKGGFGMVYHGYLENGTEVAVKMRSQSSSQGAKEFLAEAENLARVHHRNLISLVGYCRDGNCLALVYEYMSRGTLQENLRGNACKDRALSWGKRLQIAVDAAQGLEYLHKGCKPPLIHRDVKTSNILLSQRLEAKIADFGLSRVFHSDVQSHVSTAVVGTPGYLDPEYYNTFQLSEKSDVYSFGVVLLELITGQPPIISVVENCNIIRWVRQRLAKGNIEDAIDARMKGEYDVNSVWKAADVALNCTKQASIQRPSMADVVMQLKEGLALEAARERGMNGNLFSCSDNIYTESSDGKWNSTFEIEHVGKISEVSGPATR